MLHFKITGDRAQTPRRGPRFLTSRRTSSCCAVMPSLLRLSKDWFPHSTTLPGSSSPRSTRCRCSGEARRPVARTPSGPAIPRGAAIHTSLGGSSCSGSGSSRGINRACRVGHKRCSSSASDPA